LKLNFKPRYTLDYTIEVLYNIVAIAVTLGVSQHSPLKDISTQDLQREKVLTRTMSDHTFPLYDCHGFLLDLRVGVLTDVENNGTLETRWFIQVRASVRIKTLHPMCIACIMIPWVETPSTPLLLG
jgi:hypothetical protein